MKFDKEELALISEAIRGYIQEWTGTIPEEEESKLEEIRERINKEIA